MPTSLQNVSQKNREAIERAINDPNLLLRGVVECIELYHLPHAHVVYARRVARKRLAETSGTQALLAIDNQVKARKLRNKLERAHKRYPRIFSNLLRKSSMAAVGKMYSGPKGKALSRELIRQLRGYLDEYAVLTRTRAITIVVQIEKGSHEE